jgi:hypothetical protein
MALLFIRIDIFNHVSIRVLKKDSISPKGIFKYSK